MKKTCLLVLALVWCYSSQDQITITASDMPVSGDTLRYSLTATTQSTINLNDTGANKTWNYSSLTPIAQQVDEYKSALQVNPLYIIIGITAYGYKVADTLGLGGGQLPITVTEVYNFFNKKNNPSRYVAEAFAAKISGVPVPSNHTDEDEVYFFPLKYGNPEDSSDFKIDVAIPSVGSLIMDGYRKTKVDGWGTIVTPFYTTPQNCIRVRSEVVEVDSVKISPLPALGLPRTTVEYKWLINGEHYPALWVTANVVAGNEVITAVRYRDKYRPLSVATHKTGAVVRALTAYPNPATDEIELTIPSNKQYYTVEVFDLQGKLLVSQANSNVINTSKLPSGNYVIRALFDEGIGIAKFSK